MESTGQPGRIQASESTADQLRDWERGHWLEMRPDKVFAKGKGEMQT
jgi:class 3 adenylate cyclase